MTVAATNTRELDIGKLLHRSMQMAGIMSFEQAVTGDQWLARAAFGRDQLELILDTVPMRGGFVRNVEFYELTLPSSGNYGGPSDPIDLPSDTIDLIGTAMYKHTSSSTELQVFKVDREQWQTSLDKEVNAQPTRYYVHRLGTVQLYFLPVPNTSGATVRFQRQKLLADSISNTDTPDLERYWHEYLMWELASRFAISAGQPSTRVNRLERKAQESMQTAETKARGDVAGRFELDHPCT